MYDKYMSKEEKIEYLNLLADEYEKMIEQLERIKPVIASLDGRVLNKRITDAINASVSNDYLSYRSSDYRTFHTIVSRHNDTKINIRLFDKKEEGKARRLDSSRTIAQIDKSIDSLKWKVNYCRNASVMIDDINKRIDQIFALRNEFITLYGDKPEILHACDADFKIKRNSYDPSFACRNYNF